MSRTALLAVCSVLLAGVAHADSLYVRLLGRVTMPSEAVAVAARNYAYVCASGLRVVSIADPAHPVEVGHCEAGTARGVAVSGGYAYVADLDSFMRVFSILDPANPVEVARCPTAAPAVSIVVSGTYVYVGLLEKGLCVISVADPAHPVEVGRVGTYYPYGLAASGSYVYAATGELRIISVSDPAHPTEVGYYYSPSGAINAVAVRGQYAYVAIRDSTFRVISVADPTNPVEVGKCFYYHNWPTVAPQDIEVTRGYAFLATWWGGLRIIDIVDPASPKEIGCYDLGTSWSVALDGDYVFFTAHKSLYVLQFYQLGDLDIDNDSLDVSADTLRLRRWAATPGESLESVRGEFVLANTSVSYNPDSIDGPSVSPVDSLTCTGSLTGPGGTIDSIVIPNLPESLAQGQTLVCTLAAYLPAGLEVGDYTGFIYIGGKDTANLQVYESCCVFISKLGDLDVDNDSLDVVADTIRLTNLGSGVIGEFILANTSASYNPDTSDGPSRSPIDSLSFTGSLTGQSGTIDSIIIPNLPQSLSQGQVVVCTLAVYVPESLPAGDYAGLVVITGFDSVHYEVAETVYALVKKVPTAIGDLDVDNDSLGVVHDTMTMSVQPVALPSGTARFMLVNTSSSYNPDAEDGPSQSTLREVEVKAKVEAQNGAVDSVNVLNLPESLAVGQAVECTLALVIPVGESLGGHSGWVAISAYDTLGYSVRDSFFLVVRGPQPRQNLDSLRVAPIPFKPHQNPEHDAIHFQGLSAGAKVVVYDASGQSVWSATETGDGHLAWKAEVASGIYVYLVVSADGKASKVGKLSVIR